APPRPTVPLARIMDGAGASRLLFLHQGSVDLNGNWTLEPVRWRAGQAIGDAFTVDITSILGEGEPCADCIRLTEIGIDGTKVDISLGLKHPFPIGPVPSAGTPKARNDLHVFDVRGYMAPQSGGPAPIPVPNIDIDTDGDGVRDQDSQVVAGHVLNPDGFGPEFQIFAEPFLGELPGNIHPFKDYFWDPSSGSFSGSNPNGFADVRSPVGQNVFAQGTTIGAAGSIQTYKLQTIEGKVNFFFAVTCAYGASATYPLSLADPTQLGSRSNPKYFLPAMHRPEAVRVTASIPGTLGAGDTGSATNLTVTVIDWQGGRTPKGSPLVLSDDPTTIPQSSDVKEVVVDIPGILNAAIVRATPDTGNGTVGNPYQYVISIPNQRAAAQGKYPGLVAVRDELSDFVPTVPRGVGRDLAPVNLREFTTFQGFVAQVGPSTAGAYVADTTRLNVDLTNPIYTGRTGADVELDLSVVNTGVADVDGVYMPATGNAGLVRYALDYSAGVTYGAALTPLYTSNVVPDPDNPPPGFDPARRMPITAVDLGFNGVGFAAATDDFDSMLFDESEDPPGTQTGQRSLSNSSLLFNYYRSTNPPSGVGPVLWFEDLTPPTSDTGQPFAFLPGVYNDNAATPENEFLLSLADNPIPADCFEAGNADDGRAYYGGVWVNSQNAANGNRPFQVLRGRASVPGATRGMDASGLINQLNFGIPEFSGIHIVAGDMLYLGSGTEEIWLAFATNHIAALRWPGVGGQPGGSPEANVRADLTVASGIPVDLEVLPFSPTSPRTINGILQNSPVVVVLTDSGTIEVLNNVYAATPQVMQTVTLAAVGITGSVKHLDVDDTTFDIHVTTLDKGVPRASVLKLG
ncbi:MAG TPA: hypothetical protein VEI97_18045, partial [bacterium]|nr:hypothetical protein [bacterium]